MGFDIARARRPGLMRRLAALLYDLILLFGMLLLAATLVVIPYVALSGAQEPLVVVPALFDRRHLPLLRLFLGPWRPDPGHARLALPPPPPSASSGSPSTRRA